MVKCHDGQVIQEINADPEHKNRLSLEKEMTSMYSSMIC